MAKRKKAQDGTALPRSLDPKYKAAIEADRKRIEFEKAKAKQPSLSSGKPANIEETKRRNKAYAKKQGLGYDEASGRVYDPISPQVSKTLEAAYENMIEPMMMLEGAGALSAPLKMAAKQALKESVESGLLSQTYKINPWAFKPQKGKVYRQVGKPGFDDAITEGKIFDKGQKEFLENNPNINYLDEYNKAIKAKGVYLKKPSPAPFFSKDELFFPINRKATGIGNKKTKFSDSEYLFEGSVPEESLLPRYRDAYLKPTEATTNTFVLRPEYNDLSNFNLYKRDWLRGYKPIKTKQQGGSVESRMGGLTDKGFNYNGAWGGTMQMGGVLPGAIGNMYARHGAPSEGKYAKKTMASAQNGMKFYQAGLDFQPKTISKKGSKIKKDDDGYWNPENWGEPVEIDSPNITMEGVYEPLIGVSDTGDVQYMEPGENYTFDGSSVIEYPVARKGVSVNKADEAPLKKLDQLLNFTNYNDMKKAKKGKNIPKAQMGMSGFGNPAFTSAMSSAAGMGMTGIDPNLLSSMGRVTNAAANYRNSSFASSTPMLNSVFANAPTNTVADDVAAGKSASMSQFSMPGSLGASPLAKDIEFIGMAKQALKERKKAKQSLAVSEVVKQAATMRPDIQKRKYVRPEDNLLQPDQMGMMPYGTGYDVLGMAENGMQIGGNLTEIQNMYNPGTLYDNLGYEPLDESSKVKQFKKGGGIPKAQMGIQEAGMELLSLGQGLRNQAILSAINRKTNKWTEQATQNLQQGAMNQAIQTQFSPFMKNGGSLDVSDEYKWVSHSWQPQVITKFGEYNVGELLKPDPTMDTLRTGGNIRSNYMGDDEMVRSMAMGGNLQTHWGGEGEVMSYNPYMPGSGETVMLKGNSHEESDGQGNTGVGMSYSGNMVEAERGEPVVEMQEGGSVDDTSAVVFGNMKIPSYGISELGDNKAKGKKFKSYAADLAKQEQKQSKIVDKATKMIDNIEGDSPYDMLKMNSAQAMIMGADMSLKDLANKKKTLAGVQNAILDTAEEMGLESDALAKGKIQQAKKGAKIPKGQQGVYIPQPGLSSNLTERKRLIDAGRKIIEDLYNAGETGTPPNLYTDEDFLKIGEKNVGKTLDEVKVVGRKKPTAPRQLSESVYLPTMEAFEKAYKDVVPKTSPSINQQGFNLYIPTPGGVSPNMGQLTFSERQSAPITPTASVAAPVSRKVQSAPTKKQTTAAAKQQTAAKQETPAYTPAYNAKTLQANLSTPEFMQPVDFSKPARMPYYTPEGLPSDSRFEDVVSPSVYDITDTDRYFAKDLVDRKAVDIKGRSIKMENDEKAGNKIKDFLSENEGLFSALYNEALPYLRPSNQMQLQPEQLAGEMFALSTNVLQGVPAQTYQPLLETRAPQMSAQEQLNQNQADFNAMLRQVGNNPAALSVLAAQKQAADRQAIAQTQAYNTQQAIAANNRNIAMLNDASLKNLAILDTQYQRQEGAKANTKAQAQAALSSIASKIGQNKLENLTSAVMQNMYNFRFGPKGRIINYNPLAKFNIPDIMTLSDEKAAELQKALDKRKGKTEEARNGSIVKAIKGL